MKVILLQDVAKLGRQYEVVEVPHGHALNMLIPKGLAQEATAQNLKKVEMRASKKKADQEAVHAEFSKASAQLKEKKISVPAEANDKGHLFQALKSDKLSAAFAKEGVHLSESQIHVALPIKELGTHTVVLKDGDAEESIEVEVVRM